jgi:hypothetical protein
MPGSSQVFVDYRQMLALTQARQLPTAVQERLAFGFLPFVVRTDGDPAALMSAVRAGVGRVDPGAGIDAMLPMEQLVASSLTRQRFYRIDGLPHTFFNRSDLDDVAGPFQMQVREHPRGGPEVQRVERDGVFPVAREFFRRHLR